MEADSFLSSIFDSVQVFPLTTGPVVALVVAVFLLCFSSFVSASEIAFLALSPSDKNSIEESDLAVDKTILSLLNRLEYLLATILIWNIFVNITTVILFTYAVNRIIVFSHAIALGFILEAIALTFILLLFGEIIPRIYAQNYTLDVARRTAPVIRKMEALIKPVLGILVKSTNIVGHSLKKKKGDVSVDELSKALELTSKEITDEKEMLEGIIKLYNKTAVEIMTPRIDIADLDIKQTFSDVIKYIVDVGYSRIPVFSENQDNIRGVLYIKDLLPYLREPDSFRWQSLIRPAFFVPEKKKIDDLLEEFRTNKIHLAIVVDEFGGTSGIVTMEDILEEIVGEISDEYDDDDDGKFIKLADSSYVFDAKILLTDFFRVTGLHEKEFEKLTGDADTLAGLILEIKGDFPERDEEVSIGPYSFKILEMNKKRILKIRFYKDRPLLQEENSSE
ncbi:MAG: gliding motility-associated protein GldE [Dysgonamonadaceae bacterium]|nr:gliding motility-associated protein GldE [Dysgonamonadaceae bacterium]